MNYAGFWIRFLAYLVDGLIVSIAFFAIVALLGVMGLELISNELILFAMGVLYYAFMQASARQATFGKALVGLKVGGPNGERISLGRSLAREVAKILSVLTFFLGFIIAGFTNRKQALHDFIATTCVVRVEPGHVVAALAVAVVALLAPFVVVFMFGAGLVAGVFGGIASTMQSGPQVAVQAPKPAAPPAAPVAKPQPGMATASAPSPAPGPSASPKTVPVATPVVTPTPAVATPAAVTPAVVTPAVVTPVSAPVVVAQAPAAPKEPAKLEPPKPEPAKPAAEPAKPEPEPRMAQEPPAPVLVPARPMAPRMPRFNDLTTAVLYGDSSAVEELLRYGKWADKPDSTGLTPLMLAVQMGDAVSAELLLKAGANPNRPGSGGNTAMKIARERKETALIGLLQRYGGR